MMPVEATQVGTLKPSLQAKIQEVMKQAMDVREYTNQVLRTRLAPVLSITNQEAITPNEFVNEPVPTARNLMTDLHDLSRIISALRKDLESINNDLEV